jgi:hypothetical protein
LLRFLPPTQWYLPSPAAQLSGIGFPSEVLALLTGEKYQDIPRYNKIYIYIFINSFKYQDVPRYIKMYQNVIIQNREIIDQQVLG